MGGQLRSIQDVVARVREALWPALSHRLTHALTHAHTHARNAHASTTISGYEASSRQQYVGGVVLTGLGYSMER